MTTPEAGMLTDIHGEPFYISLSPCIARCKDDSEPGELPVVTVTVNGGDQTIEAGDAWKTGLTMIRASFQAVRMTEVVPVQFKMAAGISFSFGDSPLLEVDPETAEEIGVNLMGAAVSALHDVTVFRHLTTARGWAPEQVIELFADIHPINASDLLS